MTKVVDRSVNQYRSMPIQHTCDDFERGIREICSSFQGGF